MHLQRQIERLKKQVLAMAALVEDNLGRAVHAVQSHDASAAQQIIANDDRVDRMELEIEEECLHTLALHQPVAFDLRYVVAVLKMNNDLERIGDLTCNIAEQAVFLAECDGAPPYDLSAMAQRVQWMLKTSLDALVNSDTIMARKVCDSDEQVDSNHRQTYHLIESAILREPSRTGELIHYLSISRQLERIGDHAVNISEDVIYMVQGDIMRHSRLRETDGSAAKSK